MDIEYLMQTRGRNPYAPLIWVWVPMWLVGDSFANQRRNGYRLNIRVRK